MCQNNGFIFNTLSGAVSLFVKVGLKMEIVLYFISNMLNGHDMKLVMDNIKCPFSVWTGGVGCLMFN